MTSLESLADLDLVAGAAGLEADTTELRRTIHQRPELGLQLPETQATILEAITGLGLDVTLGEATTSVVAELGIAVGVIATPAEGAQDVADVLVEAGITSILNFTAHPIVVPEQIVVRRVDLATELQILSFYQQRGVGASSGAGVPLEIECAT